MKKQNGLTAKAGDIELRVTTSLKAGVSFGNPLVIAQSEYPLTSVNGKEYSTMQLSALLFPFPSAKADGLKWVACGHQPEGWCWFW